jgi:hypothetical protein
MVLDNDALAIPNGDHISLLLRHIFNLLEASIEKEIVDRGSQNGETNINAIIDVQLLEDIDDADSVLKQKEWLRQDVKHILEIVWNLDLMLVSPV